MGANRTVLSKKQEMFCQEYIKDLNGTQAAKRAGYSPNTANEQASQLLAKLNIKQRVDELKKERMDRIKIDQDYVLTQAVKIHERCMQEVSPLIVRGEHVKDSEGNPLYVFDAKAATASLKLIGEHIEVQAFRKQVGVGNPDGSKIKLSDTEIAARVASIVATAQARKDKDV